MKIQYKNVVLERIMVAVNGLAIFAVAATFVLLYGFEEEKPILSATFLYVTQFISLIIFLAEKLIRFFNAESKTDFVKYNWFEIPLLFLLFLAIIGAGRWFAMGAPGTAILITVDAYLVLQVISKLCRSMVSLAATGKSPARALASVFVVLIWVGSGLLMLPRFHNLDEGMDFTDAIFTATSATCVTGLIVLDTGGDFSNWGQVVILALIQLGGLGIVFFGAVMALLLGQALSVRESAAMQDLLNAQTLSRIGKMIAFILLTTILIEAVGAVSLYPMWNDPSRYTTSEGKWFCSIFHSISAFCNAGFSLFERSLIDYNASAGVYAVIAPLIILGGLGFGVLYNLWAVFQDRVVRFARSHSSPSRLFFTKTPERLQLQTKIVLSVSAFLIIAGTLALMLFEMYSSHPQHDSRFRIALFQSITARTAGFNTIDIASLSEASKFILILLMFIGGSPGSTAGGIKTVTFAVVVMIAWASFRKRRDVEMFRRSIRLLVVGRAITVVLLFFVVLLVSTLGLVITERANGFSFLDILFEAASALGTVGLTTGITPLLTTAGKWIIIVTMLIGRLGPLTLLAGLTHQVKPAGFDYPPETVIVG